MNKKLNNSIDNIYSNDIKNMYDAIDCYIPKLDNWYLNQSIMFEDDKKIVFKAITDDDEKIGNQVSIVFNNDDRIVFTKLKDKVFLCKSYTKDNIFEYMSVSKKNNCFYRNLMYSRNNDEYSYCEKYNLDNNTNIVMRDDFDNSNAYDLSLENILEGFKSRESDFSKKRK